MSLLHKVPVLEAPIISQVWDQLESPDSQQTQQPSGFRRSSSSQSADGMTSVGDDGGGRKLSIKNIFKTRSIRITSRQSRQAVDPPGAFTSLEEPGSDDTSLLTNHVIAAIPSTEIDLANYIVAHGILSKELR